MNYNLLMLIYNIEIKIENLLAFTSEYLQSHKLKNLNNKNLNI